MTYRKKLIEVALPLEAINEASAREKSIRHGHPSTLHLWWARRPLAAARAVIFASLVDDPDAADAPPAFVAACRALPRGKNAIDQDTPRMRLFDFIERLVQWESTTDETVLATARELIQLATDGNPPPLLDPFAGGGSIPLEGQRLGLEAHASDLNPVAVMINKAMIEIPPRFANRPPVNPTARQQISGQEAWPGATGLAADVRYYSEWMRQQAWERIGHLYPTQNGETVIAWLWARTVKSPNPAVDVHVPLVRSFELGKKKGKQTWVEPQVDPVTKQVSFVIKQGKGNPPEGTVNRQGGKCIVTGVPIPFEYIRNEGASGRFGMQLMAIATAGQNGRNYYPPNAKHVNSAMGLIPEDVPNTQLPEKALGFRVQLYGMRDHKDLFTPRQLTALSLFSSLVAEAHTLVYQDAIKAGMDTRGESFTEGGVGALAYAQALAVYLSFIVDKQADLSNALCQWEGTAECPRNLFGRQAISMQWNFAESNVMGDSAGSWNTLCKNMERNLTSFFSKAIYEGSVIQSPAQQLPYSNQFLLSTDPPYYDNIGYADLSDFFYVWMRRSLKEIFPSVLTTVLVPKTQELVAEPYRFNGDKDAANRYFEEGLQEVFSKFRRLVKPLYPVTIYYAFKQSENTSKDQGEDEVSSTGWETFLAGTINAGLQINGTWPMRTENAGGIRILGRNSLASSIVLVCRLRPDDAPTISRREFVNLLRRELPAALQAMQSGNIAPVDLAQATIGPGMAVYSRYRQVLEANGEALTVRAALQIINQELDAYLSEQEGEVDADTRFAIAWFDQTGFADSDFGLADVLARAKNTSVEGVVQAGLAVAGRGKVRLRHWDEPTWEHGWDPTVDTRVTVWEATHHLIYRLNTQGEGGAARLLLKLGADLASEARQLAYRLYSIGERKGWADHARAYNALVISWPAIQEEVNRLKQEQAAGAPTEQARLL